jgi:very-short-patch-repair endonuclease
MRPTNEIKTGRARRLRRAATDAETALWYRLRSRVLNGYKFIRQDPIGPYIVDFICRELTDHNYRVLRFWNNDVLGNMTGVLETIATALDEAPPHPDR